MCDRPGCGTRGLMPIAATLRDEPPYLMFNDRIFELKGVHMKARIAALTLAVLLGACSSKTPQQAGGAPAVGSLDLACTRASNCVNSLGTGGLGRLRYVGTPAQAMTLLQATLKTFPEATVVRSEGLAVEVIFTTPLGFRDQVDFRVDPHALRIDFRSRSLFGLFDWGKNQSRMQEFGARLERQSRL